MQNKMQKTSLPDLQTSLHKLPSHLALSFAVLALMVPMVACGDDGGGDGDGDGDGDIVGDGDGDAIDPTLLAAYKRALPSLDVLQANGVTDPGAANMAVGEPAEIPQQLAPMIQGVNGAIGGVITTLKDITDTPPTLYNSETSEFLWGPYADNDSPLDGDFVLVYIKDNGADSGEDFRYAYAFARGIGNDVSTFTPVIWGGSNPDPDNEDYGSGITLWDLEANRAFLDANDPDHTEISQGRFAAVYAKGVEDDGAEVTWVVAAFRNFLPGDAAAGDEPADVDHLYGHVEGLDDNGDPLVIDFANTRAEFNILPEDDASVPELYDIAGVGINSTIGRGEITITGGNLDDVDSPGSQLQVVECWDGMGNHLYKGTTLTDVDDNEVAFGDDEGVSTDCDFLDQPLSALNLPNLDNIDQGLLDALGGVAENGIDE